MAFLKPQQLVNWLFSFHGLSRGPLYHYKTAHLSLPDSLFLFRLTSVPSLNRDCLPSFACPRWAVWCCLGTLHPTLPPQLFLLSHSQVWLPAACKSTTCLHSTASRQPCSSPGLSSIYFSFPKWGSKDESEANCRKWLGVEEEQGLQGKHNWAGNHHSSVTASTASWGQGPSCQTSFYKKEPT